MGRHIVLASPVARLRMRECTARKGGRADLYAGFCCRPPLPAWAAATIHLGPLLPAASCDLPADSGEQPSSASCAVLLRTGFTEPRRSPAALVGSYPTLSPSPTSCPMGGLLSVALSRGSPRVAVSHRPALWSPDVPQPCPAMKAVTGTAAARSARPHGSV